MEYILSLDIGTTGTRAFLYNRECSVVSSSYAELRTFYPRNGWVEQDAEDIYEKTLLAAEEVIRKAVSGADRIAAVGITNQRETTVIWDRKTGFPACPAVVWQDRRTQPICQRLEKLDGEDIVRRTGMILVPNDAATKIAWLRENDEKIRRGTDEGTLLYGTLDTYVIWKLTGGQIHITDTSNNSVTLLQNAETLDYDEKVLEILDIPRHILPEIRDSSEIYAETDPREFFGMRIPIAGILGDQQAAAIGQCCLSEGIAKNTYGTGSFIVMNTGSRYVAPSDGLFSPVVYSRKGMASYGLEGMADVSASVLQWLRDGLGIVRSPEEVEQLASAVDSCGDVYFVPAFAGLGAPYFDPTARGMIIGLTQGSTRNHIARAALESMAFQVCDAFLALEKKSGIPLQRIRVDGGGARSDMLLQIQADLLGIPVERPQNTEATSLGAAFMAGLAVGYWSSLEQITDYWKAEKTFVPSITAEQRGEQLARWHTAVEKARSWLC